MVTPLSLPVVMAQSHIAQHFQVAAHNAPARHQAVLSDIAVRKFAHEKGQVPAADPISQLAPQKEHQGSKHLGPEKTTPRRKQSGDPDKADLFSKNIVDIKV